MVSPWVFRVLFRIQSKQRKEKKNRMKKVRGMKKLKVGTGKKVSTQYVSMHTLCVHVRVYWEKRVSKVIV